MSETRQYLDGFLAAVRPAVGRAADDQPAITPPADPVAPPVDASADGGRAGEEFSRQEQVKRQLHPLDSFPRLLECVKANRPPEEDDRFRFQWFGLFYQGPRQDAFVLRLRLPGGRLAAFQFAGLADITQECAGGHVVLNSWGGLEVPGVPVRAAAEILRRVEGIGLSARQTGGDCVQNVHGGQYDGLTDDEEVPPVFPLVCELEQSLSHNRRLADLPRACEIVFQKAGERFDPGLEGRNDCLVLQALPCVPATPLSGPAARPEPAFFLVAPGDGDGGWQLPASRVAVGCLALLETWAMDTDRSRRQNSGLATFCGARGPEEIGRILGEAKWLPTSPLSKQEWRLPPPGLPLPGGRLLSNQLCLIAGILREQKLPDARLTQSGLHLGRVADASAREAVRLVLEAR